MVKRLTEKENSDLFQTLKTGYANGKSVRQLSKDNGVSYGKVHKLLREGGVKFRPRGGPNGPRK